MSGKSRKWSHKVTTVSTFPPEGLFTQDADTIAATLMQPDVSPGGPLSGLRMLIFYINRAGKNLPPERRAELERAKQKMREAIQQER